MSFGYGKAAIRGLLLAFLLIACATPPLNIQAAAADDRLQVSYVYNQQCLSCQHVWPVIKQTLDESGVPVNLTRYEITSKDGAAFAQASGVRSVPTLIVNCGPPMSLEDYDSEKSFIDALRSRISCEAGTGSCHGAARHHCESDRKLTRLSAPAAFTAGLIAGFNPCLLAVLAFIAGTTLSAAGRRIDILARVLAFCGGLLSVYMLIGIGLIGLIGRVPGLETGLKAGIVLLLIGFAAWSFYDAYRTRKGVESRSFRAVLERLGPAYRRFGMPVSFAIGAAFGLVKMPCVGGLYIAILGTILTAGRAMEGIGYLVIYNLGVIAPVLALGLLLVLGLTPGTINRYRHRYRVELKMFSGILLAAMAAGFALGVI